MEVFDRMMPTPNQIDKRLEIAMTADDLLEVPAGAITEAGLRQNIAVALGYLEAWLRGIGCVPLFNLMEDAAIAEISRAQLWQWVHHGAVMEDGRRVDAALCDRFLHAEVEAARSRVSGAALQSYVDAALLVRQLIEAPCFTEFLTLPAYRQIMSAEKMAAA
jgi:malate synthase